MKPQKTCKWILKPNINVEQKAKVREISKRIIKTVKLLTPIREYRPQIKVIRSLSINVVTLTWKIRN